MSRNILALGVGAVFDTVLNPVRLRLHDLGNQGVDALFDNVGNLVGRAYNYFTGSNVPADTAEAQVAPVGQDVPEDASRIEVAPAPAVEAPAPATASSDLAVPVDSTSIEASSNPFDIYDLPTPEVATAPAETFDLDGFVEEFFTTEVSGDNTNPFDLD